MDETFQLRAKRMLGPRQSAPLDYQMLSAALIAQQAATPGARAQDRFNRAVAAEPERGLPAEPPVASPGWQEAACAQHGCFNRAEVKRRRKKP